MTEFQNRKPGRWERAALRIFVRPLYAALLSGLFIHIAIGIGETFITGNFYLNDLVHAWQVSPLLGTLKLLAPFLVPYLFFSISHRHIVHHELDGYFSHPKADPNIVMKIDGGGHITYINPTGEQICRRLGIAENEYEEILPPNYKEMLNNFSGRDEVFHMRHEIGGLSLEFRFRSLNGDASFFVTGYDQSEKRTIEESLNHVSGQMSEILDFLDTTFTMYDPRTFSTDRHYRVILKNMLRERNENRPEKATHILFCRRDAEGNLTGHVYWKENDYVMRDPNMIRIDAQDASRALTRGITDVIWSNWENEAPSLVEYQAQFPKVLRAKVGVIERFVTYLSGPVVVAAFYTGRPVARFDAYLLKGLATFTHSMKVISEESQATENAFIYTVEALARAAEANDLDTSAHLTRVNEYSRELADALGMESRFVQTIHYSAQMHDVGKIHIHQDILRKPGLLTKKEEEIMRQHTVIGARILGDSPRLAMAAEIAMSHHENWDGTGYPEGIAGEEIPVSGRIVKVSDVYDALRQKRAYKPTLPHEEAVKMMSRGSGRTMPTEFDPEVLAAFLRVENRLEEIYEEHQLMQDRKIVGEG